VLASADRADEEMVLLRTSLNVRFGWASWCKPQPVQPLTLAIFLGPSEESDLALPAGFGALCMGAPTSVSVELANP
jgi:hypothetical protein